MGFVKVGVIGVFANLDFRSLRSAPWQKADSDRPVLVTFGIFRYSTRPVALKTFAKHQYFVWIKNGHVQSFYTTILPHTPVWGIIIPAHEGY